MEKLSVGNNRLQIMVLIAVCLVTAFASNGVFIPDIMESRNIVTAREMVYDGNWVVTTMNGDLRFEKPPLPTWITALAEIISPGNIELMRGMAGLAALLLFYFFYRTARDVIRVNPVVSTLFFCTCYSVVLMSHTASWDIYCHAFMMGGIYWLARALESDGRNIRAFLLSGIFTGLSIMSKGPVSLFALFLPFLIAFIWLRRPSMKGKWGGLILMALTALLVGCWWYGYIYFFHSDDLSAVAAKESGSWMNRNVRPWYYYWKFFLESGVWSLFLPTALILPLFSHRRMKGWALSALWLIVALILLSLMPEKKTRYLFPILIPGAMVMGCMAQMWHQAFKSGIALKRDKVLMRINAWLIAAVVVAIPFLAWKILYCDGGITPGLLIALSVVCLIAGFFLIFSGIRLRPYDMVYSVTFFFIMAENFFLPLAKPLINNPEMKSLSATKEMKELDGINFYHKQGEELRIEMVYAAGRKIRPLDYSNAESLKASLPMVVLTHTGAANELNPEIFEETDTVYIGRFDDNRRSVTSGKYNPTFLYHATLVKPKASKHN